MFYCAVQLNSNVNVNVSLLKYDPCRSGGVLARAIVARDCCNQTALQNKKKTTLFYQVILGIFVDFYVIDKSLTGAAGSYIL